MPLPDFIISRINVTFTFAAVTTVKYIERMVICYNVVDVIPLCWSEC